MANPSRPSRPRADIGAFGVACWVLAFVAFSQLIVAATALSRRFEESRVARVVEKPEPIVVRIRAPENPAPAPERADITYSSDSVPPVLDNLPPPTPLAMPPIADPVAEKLVIEARTARISGDMASAIAKLEDALIKSPDEPTIQYEMAATLEQMGVFDKASSYYQRVFDAGQTKAGALYGRAAAKLRDGLAVEQDMRGKMSIERVSIFKDNRDEEQPKVVLSIPIQKAHGEEVDPQKVGITLDIYNRTSKGQIVHLDDNTRVSTRFLRENPNWNSGEETLRAIYSLPPQLDPRTGHLFGQQDYYGFVATLTYGNDILDCYAWPRDLAALNARAQNASPSDSMASPELLDSLPPDYDPAVPLLPVPLD